MPDDTTGAVSAPGAAAPSVTSAKIPSPAGWIGGFPPAALVDPAPAPAAPVEKAAETPPPVEKPALADLIRKQREDRVAREQAASQAKDWESKYKNLEGEIEKLRRDSDFENDPVAYAKARNWDKDKQALMGQMLLYDLVPDKAPPDLRLRLFESKQAREKREAEEQRKAEAIQHEQRGQQEQYQTFVAAVDQAAAAFEPGSYPESQAWFISPETGDVDHDTYVRSLVATAVNMANAAQRENRVADLSPVSIAKTLEAEVARRMAARDGKRQKAVAAVKSPAVQQETPGVGGTQPTESTKGTYGSGAPQPKAASDKDRLDRAMAVVFRTPGSR